MRLKAIRRYIVSDAFSLRPEDPATVIHGAGDDYRYLATGKPNERNVFCA